MFQTRRFTPERTNVRQWGRGLGERLDAARRSRGSQRMLRLRSRLAGRRPRLGSAMSGVTEAGKRLAARSGPSQAGRGRRRLLGFAWPFLLGALAMFLFDPRMGRRRRARIRDRSVWAYHLAFRRLPGATRRRGVWVRDRVKGVGYELRHAITRDGHGAADDVELAQRVRSEVFRDPEIPDGAINVDAYEGVVTLRGELHRPELIERVVEATERVQGVRQVRSLLHLPKTRPPNAPPDPALGEEFGRQYQG